MVLANPTNKGAITAPRQLSTLQLHQRLEYYFNGSTHSKHFFTGSPHSNSINVWSIIITALHTPSIILTALHTPTPSTFGVLL